MAHYLVLVGTPGPRTMPHLLLHTIISSLWLRPSRRRWGLPAVAFAASGLAAHAEPVVYLLDPAHTQITWEVRHFGTSTSRGRLTDVVGSISLDRAKAQGDVSMVIGTASGSSGVPPLDSILRGPYFFDSKNYPSAYFVASRWRFDAQGGAELRGEFTLRDVSRPLSLRTSKFSCYKHPALAREVCGGDFEAELQRSDFGISYGLPLVGNRVHLLIQIEAIRQTPE